MLKLIGKSLAVVLIIASVFCSAYAEDTEDMSAAIEKTQKDIRNTTTRAEMIKSSPEAAKAAEKVKALSGGSANEAEMYDLAADVLTNMKGMSQEQILEMMQKAQKDPEAFVKTWSPEQRKKLEKISDRIPASKNAKHP
ncbi:hypothetical protein [Bdellovibrio sp. HCB209]|uniref:hypothetical protein n=1 Tax=Bdellovibrio sp. HCB209 TaxID=3394354 RepID=UPI0039B5B303